MEIAYVIRYHPSVVHDDIPALDAGLKERMKDVIERKLMTEPDLFGVPLRQSLKGHRKLRVGDYRIIFRIDRRSVIVIAIQHRSIVYQRLARRLDP